MDAQGQKRLFAEKISDALTDFSVNKGAMLLLGLLGLGGAIAVIKAAEALSPVSTPLSRMYERKVRLLEPGQKIACTENTISISQVPGLDIAGQALHGTEYNMQRGVVISGTSLVIAEQSIDVELWSKMRVFHAEARQMNLCHQPSF